MITITIDHSYEDDYHMISYISIDSEDEKEKERIIKKFEEIDGALVDPDGSLDKRIAEALGVDVKLVNLDTEEIDLM